MTQKYIFFDLDGTLTDPKEGITGSVAYALESFGIHVENRDDLCCFIGPPLLDSFMEYYGMTEDDANRAIAKYRERFSVTGLFENEVYSGIPQLLQQLKDAGKTLVIATSKPAVFSQRILDHFDLAKYFTFLSGSELDGRRNDKAEVIAYALEQTGITDLSDVIMIGDRKHDIVGAKKNGLPCIGVLYGYGDRAEHVAAGADYIVESVDELKKLLLA